MNTQSEKKALLKAINLAGGQTALAKKLGVKQQTVYWWLNRGLPLKRVIEIEAAVNRSVTRYELKPDFYPAN